MSWTILGEPGLSFRVDERGITISGEGRQVFRPTTTVLGCDKIETLPARWDIYRASEASETAMAFSFNLADGKHYLDVAAVKVTTKPISIITFYEKIDYANPSCVIFSIFLPDAYFANIWKLAKLITANSDMSYQIRFGFNGFMPRKIPERDDVLSYEEWLAGRPCISKEDFAFVLQPIRKEKLEPNDKTNSFDPTQTGI
jgi:hypothetical protein